MSFGNTIDLLSTTANILLAGNWTSSNVIAGEFVSITVDVYSDVTLSVQIQFSNNAVNWDIIESFNVAASNATYQSSVILGKWIRIIATNTDVGASTDLRLYTYGSPSNISTQSIIVPSIAGKTSSVSVANFPVSVTGNSDTSLFNPFVSFNFEGSVPAQGKLSEFGTNLPLTLNSTESVDDIFQVNAGVGLALPTITTGSFVSLSEVSKYPLFPHTMVQYTASFVTGDASYQTFAGIGNITHSNAALVLGDALGWGVMNGIIYIIYWLDGVKTQVAQASWNVDRFDGTQQANLVLNFASCNRFQIKFSLSGDIIFSIQDISGVFLPCHVVLNPVFQVSKKVFGFISYILGYNNGSSAETLVDVYDFGISNDFTPQKFRSSLDFYYDRAPMTAIADDAAKYVMSIKNTPCSLYGSKYGMVRVKEICLFLRENTGTYTTNYYATLKASKNGTITGQSYAKNTQLASSSKYLTEIDVTGSAVDTYGEMVKNIVLTDKKQNIVIDTDLLNGECINFEITIKGAGTTSDLLFRILYSEFF